MPQGSGERWGEERMGDVMAVVDAALPGERLTDDEVRTVLFDDPDPTCVFGIPGVGVAAGVLRPAAAHVQLMAVAPDAQRAGYGGALLRDVHRWAFEEHGAGSVVAGGGAPFSLWPGVDVYATGAHCLFDSFGYEAGRGHLELAFPSRFRATVPAGVLVRRVLGDADVEAVLAFVVAHWPHWMSECRRGIEHGACHVAVEAAAGDTTGEATAVDVTAGDVIGFGCHSVNRVGVLGPIGTHPSRRRAGVANAVMSAIATDVMVAGIEQVHVPWTGASRFFVKAAGATTARAYLSFVLRRPPPPSA